MALMLPAGLKDQRAIKLMQHYGTNARESELIAAAERVLAGAAS